MTLEVLTIGHSTLDYESFLTLLREAKITAVADVRSTPYSRNEEFNRDVLKKELASDRIFTFSSVLNLVGVPKTLTFIVKGSRL